MGEALFKITADGADVSRSLNGVVTSARRANAELTASARSESAARRRIENEEVNQARRDFREMAAARIRAANESVRAKQSEVAKAEALEKKATKDADRESKARLASEKRNADEAMALQERLADYREQQERKATAAQHREATRRIAEARREQERISSFVPSSQGGGGARVTSRVTRGEMPTPSLSQVATVATRVLSAVGEYGDNIRDQQNNRAMIDADAQRVANSTGNRAITPEIMAAVQSVSTQTGMLPTEALAGLKTAQDSFSSLQDPASRREYLQHTFPMLARAAVASGTPMADMVGAAGEYTRQFHLEGDAATAAIARSIARGRLGSVEFGDEARHMGAIGGAATRFLSTDPAHAQQSLDIAESLFQTAGQAGGGGDVAATRTRGFLSNLTSARGQARLTSLVGHRVFDATGQLITRNGESQEDAFNRTIETAWSSSHGNANQFLTAVGGTSQRSREVADQLMKDLRANGGHLTHFRELENGGGATADTVDPAFDAMRSTQAVRNAMQENRTFFNNTDANTNQGQSDTAQQIRDLKEKHPWISGIVDNVVGRGALDFVNSGLAAAEPQMRGYSQEQRDSASRQQLREDGYLGSMLHPMAADDRIATLLEQATTGHSNSAAGKVDVGDKITARGLGGSIGLDPMSITAIGRAVAEAFQASRPQLDVSPQAAAHVTSQSLSARRHGH